MLRRRHVCVPQQQRARAQTPPVLVCQQQQPQREFDLTHTGAQQPKSKQPSLTPKAAGRRSTSSLTTQLDPSDAAATTLITRRHTHTHPTSCNAGGVVLVVAVGGGVVAPHARIVIITILLLTSPHLLTPPFAGLCFVFVFLSSSWVLYYRRSKQAAHPLWQ